MTSGRLFVALEELSEENEKKDVRFLPRSLQYWHSHLSRVAALSPGAAPSAVSSAPPLWPRSERGPPRSPGHTASAGHPSLSAASIIPTTARNRAEQEPPLYTYKPRQLMLEVYTIQCVSD